MKNNKANQHKSDRVAIVHDWLYGGGTEKVVEQLHALYPDAPIYTAYCSAEWREKLGGRVVTGWPQSWPFSKLRKYLPLLHGWWFRSLNLAEFDLVIISSGNGEAKQIKASTETTTVCYCHTPVHFYWRNYQQYLAQPGFGRFDPLARLGLKALVKPLRRRDWRAAQRVNHFIANSSHIQGDIKEFYGRKSTVIHPPVDTERFEAVKNTEDFFIHVGRLVPYKKIDLIIEACNQLEEKLLIIGKGPEKQRLQELAGPTVKFRLADDKQVAKSLSAAKGFVFMAEEDFGIAPVEALAAGTPVVAFQRGGALDYIDSTTGEFVTEQSTESLIAAISRFNNRQFSSHHLRNTAERFGIDSFQRKLQTEIEASTSKPGN